MYLMAAENLDVPPDKMLVLEDSGNGCAAAVAAGAYTIAIPNEHTKQQDFEGVKGKVGSLASDSLHQLITGSRSYRN